MGSKIILNVHCCEIQQNKNVLGLLKYCITWIIKNWRGTKSRCWSWKKWKQTGNWARTGSWAKIWRETGRTAWAKNCYHSTAQWRRRRYFTRRFRSTNSRRTSTKKICCWIRKISPGLSWKWNIWWLFKTIRPSYSRIKSYLWRRTSPK